MTTGGNAPLEYYTAEADRPRRPRAITVIAVVGLALCGLTLVVQSIVPPPVPRPTQDYGYLYGYGSSSKQRGVTAIVAGEVGFAFGRAAANAATILMAMGCLGVLALRRGGRTLTIVASFLWVILGTVTLFALLWGTVTATSGSRTSVGGLPYMMLSVVGVVLLVQVAFPVVALLVLRRPNVKSAFPPRARVAPPVGRALRAAAWATLVCASLFVLACAATIVMAWIGPGTRPGERMIGFASDLFGAPGTVYPPLGIAGAAFGLLLYGGLLIGAVQLLRDRPSGRGWVAVACVVYAAFVLGTFESYGSPYGRVRLSPGSNVFDWASAIAHRLAFQARALLWPVLLLVLVSRRESIPDDAPGGI